MTSRKVNYRTKKKWEVSVRNTFSLRYKTKIDEHKINKEFEPRPTPKKGVVS